MERLITDYEFELAEAGCAPGSGRYGVRVVLPADISAVFPYLNAVLENTVYDHENRVLIGEENERRYAFRPDDIKVAGIADVAEAPVAAREAVDRVNEVWESRGQISPCYLERKLPPVAYIFRFLPRTNCRQCGYATCLVFAAELRDDKSLLAKCRPLMEPQHADSLVQIERLFAPDGVVG